MNDAPAAARPTCPRCGRPGLREHDVYWCFEHGPYAMEDEPWDPAEIASPDAALPDRQRHRRPTPAMPAWTPEELREWETWQDGDPLPDWALSAPEEEEADEMEEQTLIRVSVSKPLYQRIRRLAIAREQTQGQVLVDLVKRGLELVEARR